MNSNLSELYALLLKRRKKERYELSMNDNYITVYEKSYPAVPIRFALVDNDTVEVRGVIGFYDSDYQKRIMLDYCKEEKENEQEELAELAIYGMRRLPSFDFYFSAFEEGCEVHMVSSWAIKHIRNTPNLLIMAIRESGIFVTNARMRFGHFILESAQSRIITSMEERRFFSTLMCSCPPGIDGQRGWFHIDLADVVNREKNFKSSTVIHVEGANSPEVLHDNIIKSLDGLFMEDECLCLRYVFPEWSERSVNPLSASTMIA